MLAKLTRPRPSAVLPLVIEEALSGFLSPGFLVGATAGRRAWHVAQRLRNGVARFAVLRPLSPAIACGRRSHRGGEDLIEAGAGWAAAKRHDLLLARCVPQEGSSFSSLPRSYSGSISIRSIFMNKRNSTLSMAAVVAASVLAVQAPVVGAAGNTAATGGSATTVQSSDAQPGVGGVEVNVGDNASGRGLSGRGDERRPRWRPEQHRHARAGCGCECGCQWRCRDRSECRRLHGPSDAGGPRLRSQLKAHSGRPGAGAAGVRFPSGSTARDWLEPQRSRAAP